jgi:Tfp pilus assembly protein PilF
VLLSKPGGDAARAEAEWPEAIRLQPGYSQARMNLAIFLWHHNQPGKAAYHFEYALRLRPDYALAHLNYALMLQSIGRNQEAGDHLRKAASSPDANISEHRAPGFRRTSMSRRAPPDYREVRRAA